MSTFDSTKTRLADLLTEITKGKLQLPDFQRGWVWDDEHIRSLLVSIARAFPIGSVMLLESGGETKFKVRPVEGIDPAVATPDKATRLILDGQQRLTSLTQVLMTREPVKTRDDKKREIKRHYYIDIATALEGPSRYEEAIFGVDLNRTVRGAFGRDIEVDLRTPEKEYEKLYFPCDQILNSDKWEEGLLKATDHARFAKYMDFRGKVLAEFRQYDVPVIELKKENKKEAVCLVFEKVNTGGVPLSVFELITATYAADGVNLRDEWFGNAREGIEGIKQHLAKQRLLREIEPNEFFQGLTLMHTLALRDVDLAAGKTAKAVTGVSAKREAVLGLPLAAYKKLNKSLMDGFWLAARFLRSEAFFSSKNLPYRTQIVPLAVVMAILGERSLEPAIHSKIQRWYWCGVLGELYGGAVESRMALDVQEIVAWCKGAGADPSTVVDASFQPDRLMTLRSKNSAAYKGISTLVLRSGARDFFWKTTTRDLDETDWEECKLDIHHIFPRKWCEEKAVAGKISDSILNKTPISFKANRKIGGRAPSDYLKQLQAETKLDEAAMDTILRTHAIDPVMLRADDFEGFIARRREALLKEIANAMGKAVSVGGEPVPEDTADEDDDR
jgi:hypothetical protein